MIICAYLIQIQQVLNVGGRQIILSSGRPATTIQQGTGGRTQSVTQSEPTSSRVVLQTSPAQGDHLKTNY